MATCGPFSRLIQVRGRLAGLVLAPKHGQLQQISSQLIKSGCAILASLLGFKHGWDSCNVLKKIDDLKKRNGKQVEVDEAQVGDGNMTEPISQAKPQRRKGKLTIVEPQVDAPNGIGDSMSAHVHTLGGPSNVAGGGEEGNGGRSGALRRNEEGRGADANSGREYISELDGGE
ncbi:hypothetical protein LIER_21905 [Lithospermum erythrorhizon]|uniref:Uncharacterized protein n=1 Tax=Lithospermum erythrorhizon TaxID=34254 RepID=A0AAV3QS31_LITER